MIHKKYFKVFTVSTFLTLLNTKLIVQTWDQNIDRRIMKKIRKYSLNIMKRRTFKFD